MDRKNLLVLAAGVLAPISGAGANAIVAGTVARAAPHAPARTVWARTPVAAAGPADALVFPKNVAQVSIPFTIVNGVPVTSAVRINGRFLGPFFIDTGARTSYISRQVADRRFLPVALQMHMTWKGHRVDIRRLRRFQIGPITFTNSAICAFGLSKVKGHQYRNQIGGIGGDILGRMPFTIDYRNSKLIFYNPKTFRAPLGAKSYPLKIAYKSGATKDGILVSRLFARLGIPTLVGTLNASPISWCPDTGTSVTAILMPEYVHDHPNLVNRQSFSQSVRDIQMRGRLFQARNAHLAVLGKTIDNPRHIYAPVTTPWQLQLEGFAKPNLLIGGRFLKNYRLTFDYAAKKVWVQWSPPRSYRGQLARGLDPNKADSMGETPLMHAALHGDRPGVAALLRAGANPLAIDRAGWTVLDYAAMGGNINIIRILLAGPAKKDVNFGAKKWPPLDDAVGGPGGPRAWQELVLAGAKVNPGPNSMAAPLFAAVQVDNIPAVRWLLKHGADVNGKNRNGQTPLSLAAWSGNFRLFNLLRQHGARLHVPENKGDTLLYRAACGGHVAMLKYILSKAAGAFPVNIRNAVGVTPLMAAAALGQLKAARFLLKSGADVNAAAPKDDNQAALFFAAAHEQPKMLSLLIRHGANVNARNSLGASALALAALNGCTRNAPVLLKVGANVNAKMNDGKSVLMCAADSGCGKIVTILLKHGAHPNSVTKSGLTPLMIAAAKNGPTAVRALIHAGAAVGAKAAKIQDLNALEAAAHGGNPLVVALLIGHGAKVNTADSAGRTALMVAAAGGHFRAARVLIKAGAAVNVATSGKNTALDPAAREGNPRIVALLIAHGAKVNAANSMGGTPLMAAASGGHFRAARALINAGATLNAVTKGKNSALEMAAQGGNPRIVALLIRHGAAVNAADSTGRGALLFAAGNGHFRAVQVLLKSRADVNAKNHEGDTPLDAAAASGYLKPVMALLHAGANVNLADNSGMTPLDYACLAKHPAATVSLLLKAGANPKLKDKKGRNALQYASRDDGPKTLSLIQAWMHKNK